MTILSEALIVIAIILTLLSQDATLRLRHTSFYTIDIDTPLIGFSLTTEKNRDNLKRKKKRDSDTSFWPYYHALTFLVSRGTLTVGKCHPTNEGDDSPITLLPACITIYALLSLLTATAERASLAKDFDIYEKDTPNIDMALRFPAIYLIISLLVIQYYRLKYKRGAWQYGRKQNE